MQINAENDLNAQLSIRTSAAAAGAVMKISTIDGRKTQVIEVGPFQMWRAVFALALTVTVCVATYLVISYLLER